jgi:hypothetical protein
MTDSCCGHSDAAAAVRSTAARKPFSSGTALIKLPLLVDLQQKCQLARHGNPAEDAEKHAVRFVGS